MLRLNEMQLKLTTQLSGSLFTYRTERHKKDDLQQTEFPGIFRAKQIAHAALHSETYYTAITSQIKTNPVYHWVCFYCFF